MPDLHTPPFFGALLRDQGCDQRHNDSIAKIVQIQDDEDPSATERFEQIERQTQEVCMEMGRRVAKGFRKTGMRGRPRDSDRDRRRVPVRGHAAAGDAVDECGVGEAAVRAADAHPGPRRTFRPTPAAFRCPLTG